MVEGVGERRDGCVGVRGGRVRGGVGLMEWVSVKHGGHRASQQGAKAGNSWRQASSGTRRPRECVRHCVTVMVQSLEGPSRSSRRSWRARTGRSQGNVAGHAWCEQGAEAMGGGDGASRGRGVWCVSLGEKAGVHGDRLAMRDRVKDDSYAEGQHMRSARSRFDKWHEDSLG